MKATIPSVTMPEPMTKEQKASMDLPVLLFLGTEDPIVGEVEHAKKVAEEYPDIRIEVLDSGHLIAVEHAAYVNSVVLDFLGQENP
jgi:pimeloyl-ACP methyl ester carboxylesterase